MLGMKYLFLAITSFCFQYEKFLAMDCSVGDHGNLLIFFLSIAFLLQGEFQLFENQESLVVFYVHPESFQDRFLQFEEGQ